MTPERRGPDENFDPHRSRRSGGCDRGGSLGGTGSGSCFAIASIRVRACASGRALPTISAPVRSAANSRCREIANCSIIATNGARIMKAMSPIPPPSSSLRRITLPASHGTLEVLGEKPRRGNRKIGFVPQNHTLAQAGAISCRDV